jgi:hypothetical protein
MNLLLCTELACMVAFRTECISSIWLVSNPICLIWMVIHSWSALNPSCSCFGFVGGSFSILYSLLDDFVIITGS